MDIICNGIQAVIFFQIFSKNFCLTFIAWNNDVLRAHALFLKMCDWILVLIKDELIIALSGTECSADRFCVYPFT